MGGIGSGRYRRFEANATEDYLSIDVRWLKREGFLRPGAGGRITWSSRGGVVASVDVRAETGYIVLAYRHAAAGGDWEDESYPVYLDTTPCHMGGDRHWFTCPARGCGRRVAILYGGEIFACRHCHRLAYPSQREGPVERNARRTGHIRRKLGWPEGLPTSRDLRKPKGMHWRTYERLCREHAILTGGG